MATLDTGGEVEDSISGRLLHDSLKGRGAGLFGCFSPQPAHQLHEIDGSSNRYMTQMGFGKTDITRAPQAHRAHGLRMGAFNACPMAIGVLEVLGALSTSCRKQRLHLLSRVQGHAAPSRSRTGGPTGTRFTIHLGKLHLDERFACILDRCPTRTDPTLWTGDCLGFPIDREVREVVASLSLIPVGLEGGANQINSIAGLTLDEVSYRDISRIDDMLLWEQFFPSQSRIDRGK